VVKHFQDDPSPPPFIKALAEVRQLATREGWCYQHVQVITIAIGQYAEKDRDYFLNKPHWWWQQRQYPLAHFCQPVGKRAFRPLLGNGLEWIDLIALEASQLGAAILIGCGDQPNTALGTQRYGLYPLF
jgi:hypothetical protein